MKDTNLTRLKERDSSKFMRISWQLRKEETRKVNRNNLYFCYLVFLIFHDFVSPPARISLEWTLLVFCVFCDSFSSFKLFIFLYIHFLPFSPSFNIVVFHRLLLRSSRQNGERKETKNSFFCWTSRWNFWKNVNSCLWAFWAFSELFQDFHFVGLFWRRMKWIFFVVFTAEISFVFHFNNNKTERQQQFPLGIFTHFPLSLALLVSKYKNSTHHKFFDLWNETVWDRHKEITQ